MNASNILLNKYIQNVSFFLKFLDISFLIYRWNRHSNIYPFLFWFCSYSKPFEKTK